VKKTNDAPASATGFRYSRGRIWFVFAILAGLLLASAIRVFILQTRERAKFAALANLYQNRTTDLYQKRGPIVDRHGALLAKTVEAYVVGLRMSKVQNLDEALAFVAGVTGASLDYLHQRAQCGIRYCLLLHGLGPRLPDALEKIRDYHPKDAATADLERISRIKALEGLEIDQEATRWYVGKDLAGPLLGRTGFPSKETLAGRKPYKYELQGLFGLEHTYDEYLSGHPSKVTGLRIRGGRISFLNDLPELKDTGNTLALTIDSTIQGIVEKSLARALVRYQAPWGVAIVEKVDTGEILAMAQAPLFNPNSPNAVPPRILGLQERIEPGSTIKPVVLAAVLNEGLLSLDDELNVHKGAMRLHGTTINDTHPMSYLTVRDLLKYSSNIGFAQLGLDFLGKELLVQYYQDFGLDKALGADPKLEADGIIRPVKSIGPVDVMNMSFGQGLLVTPLQLVNALAAIGNGGRLMRPYLVSEVRSPDGIQLFVNRPQVLRQVISPDTARVVLDRMESVMDEDGTGSLANIPGFRVAGKTGTAQQSMPIHDPLDPDRILTWQYGPSWRTSFVGLVPAERPVVAILVLLADPRIGESGGAVAAPVFAEIAPRVLRAMDLAPNDTIMATAKAGTNELSPRAPVKETPQDALPKVMEGQTLVPDFTGYTVAAALRLANNSRVELKVVGSGKAFSQSPAPDTLVAQFSEVQVSFSNDTGKKEGEK
jgi:cell division protein FtsI (penicillin-binding protein 3)